MDAPSSAAGIPHSPSSTPTKSPNAPAATPAPKIIDYTELAQVIAGNTAPNFCATVYVPASDHGLLYFTAKYGSFSQTTFEVRGNMKRCTSYTAPNAPGITADHVTIRVIDTRTDRATQRSEDVPITEPPPQSE